MAGWMFGVTAPSIVKQDRAVELFWEREDGKERGTTVCRQTEKKATSLRAEASQQVYKADVSVTEERNA